MNSLLQNVKSGFASIKELFGIFLSDEKDETNNYDLYINSSDSSLSQTAQELKTLEEEQETKRLSLFNEVKTKVSKDSKKQIEDKGKHTK